VQYSARRAARIPAARLACSCPSRIRPKCSNGSPSMKLARAERRRQPEEALQRLRGDLSPNRRVEWPMVYLRNAASATSYIGSDPRGAGESSILVSFGRPHRGGRSGAADLVPYGKAAARPSASTASRFVPWWVDPRSGSTRDVSPCAAAPGS